MEFKQSQTYRNVMELLVIEEVEKQFQKVPAKLATYINKQEVIAFALNRLPALYATSEKGWTQQYARGKRELSDQIVNAVRQGLITVEHDPLRIVEPLDLLDQEAANRALQRLQVFLHRKDISWHNLAEVVEQAIIKARNRMEMWDRI